MASPDYGWSHQRERRRWQIKVDHEGYVCTRCHQYRPPGSAFDLDHTEDRTGYQGAACPSCNRRAGAVKGRRLRHLARIRTINW